MQESSTARRRRFFRPERAPMELDDVVGRTLAEVLSPDQALDGAQTAFSRAQTAQSGHASGSIRVAEALFDVPEAPRASRRPSDSSPGSSPRAAWPLEPAGHERQLRQHLKLTLDLMTASDAGEVAQLVALRDRLTLPSGREEGRRGAGARMLELQEGFLTSMASSGRRRRTSPIVPAPERSSDAPRRSGSRRRPAPGREFT